MLAARHDDDDCPTRMALASSDHTKFNVPLNKETKTYLLLQKQWIQNTPLNRTGFLSTKINFFLQGMKQDCLPKQQTAFKSRDNNFVVKEMLSRW